MTTTWYVTQTISTDKAVFEKQLPSHSPINYRHYSQAVDTFNALTRKHGTSVEWSVYDPDKMVVGTRLDGAMVTIMLNEEN